jgi:hypothetical protein
MTPVGKETPCCEIFEIGVVPENWFPAPHPLFAGLCLSSSAAVARSDAVSLFSASSLYFAVTMDDPHHRRRMGPRFGAPD